MIFFMSLTDIGSTHDNHSMAGFEDDLQVVTAVIHELGLGPLLEE